MVCRHSENYDLYKFLPEPTFFDDFETSLNINESMTTLPCCHRSVRKPLYSSSRSPFRPATKGCFRGVAEASQKRPRHVQEASQRRTRHVPDAQGSRLQAPGSRLKAQGPRFKAQGSRLKAQGSKLKAQGSRLKAHGPRLKVHLLTK